MLNYDDIKVSTKTVIAISNVTIDIEGVYRSYPLLKETEAVSTPGIVVKTIYYGADRRGVALPEKRKKKKSFRNAINVICGVDPMSTKTVNFKLSKNGKFQMTGCKSEEQASSVVAFFISELLTHCREHITVNKNRSITVFFQTVMTNIDFSIGFKINRQKLDEFMNRYTEHHSLLETSCGYTGVNIKYQLNRKWWDVSVPVIMCEDIESSLPIEWKQNTAPLSQLTEITTEKKQKKKYNTFLVFHSGNIIMSGMLRETMKDDFDVFVRMLMGWKEEIQERIFE
jgi:TATA-box binding protein (TBP) (component of TFIID and TFIIIB)